MSTEILAENRPLGPAGANREARQILADRWSTWEQTLSAVPGKRVFSALSEWAQSQFGVSLSPAVVAREMQLSEVPEELSRVVSAVERGEEI